MSGIDLDQLDLSEAMNDLAEGLLVAPLLKTFLFNAEYPDDFIVRFRKEQRREPDGWFWPSTHPLWSAKALYTYLATPELVPFENRRYMNSLSLTMGTAIHSFIEMCLREIGIRTPELNTCTSCPSEKNCSEPGFKDPETGSRGHMDGVLDLSEFVGTIKVSGFEFKTINSRSVRYLTDMDVETYRTKHPEYYAQNQEYMRLSGLREVIVVFMQMGFPWKMVEIHVPYDEVAANQVANKYREVRLAVKGEIPPICCVKKSCPISGLCSIDAPKSKTKYLI